MRETQACPRCGSSNGVDASFCSECGASLAAPATGSTTYLAGTVCPNCGTWNPQTAQFCTACGQQLAAEPAPRSRSVPNSTASYEQGAKAMYCPVCREVVLVISERQGIEVDYCPNCRGVWLDRGELDKIIERVAQTQGEAPRYPTQPREPQQRDYRDDRDDDYRRRKKRRGFLDDLFDLD